MWTAERTPSWTPGAGWRTPWCRARRRWPTARSSSPWSSFAPSSPSRLSAGSRGLCRIERLKLSLKVWHDVLLCHHYLQVLGSSSYQRGNSVSSKSYLFLEFRHQVWKLCEAGVATQFLDSNLRTSRHSLIQGLKILTQITIRFLILVNFSTRLYIIYHQATITLGYILSPLVMRRVNTRPQVQSQRTDELSFFKKSFWFAIRNRPQIFWNQGGRIYAKGLRQKVCRNIKVSRNLRTFWKTLGKNGAIFGQKQCLLGKKCTFAWYILNIILI